MSTLLLTGPTGFIGRNALAELESGPFEIVAVCRNPAPAIAKFARWESADLMDDKNVEELLARVKPQMLVHLAWCAGRPNYRTDPQNEAWAHASIRLAQAFFERGGAHAVMAGTSAEHEASERQTLYARSKGEAAAGMHAAARSHGLRFSWGRIFLPYGPFDAPHRLVPSVIDALLEGTHAHCSPGRQVRDFVHVADVARALIDLAQSDADGPVDIGTGIGCSVHDAAEMIARQIGRQDLLRFDLPGPFGEPDRLVASPSRPAVLQHARSLEIGLAQTIAWHRARIAA